MARHLRAAHHGVSNRPIRRHARPGFWPDERTFKGQAGRGKSKGDERSLTLQFPEWCRVTITRGFEFAQAKCATTRTSAHSLGLLQCDKSLLDARGSDSSPPFVGDPKCFTNSDDGHLRLRQAVRDRYLAGITTGSRAPDIEARQL